MNKLQQIINRGSCSYFVLFLFCAFSLLLGLHIQETLSTHSGSSVGASTDPKVRVAVADRQAIIFDHALDFPTMGADERQRRLIEPILGVLQKYSLAGYLVVDALKDESGAYFVSALPDQALDITDELKAAVREASQGASASNLSEQPKNLTQLEQLTQTTQTLKTSKTSKTKSTH